MIRIHCPQCATLYRLSEARAGSMFNCARCNQDFPIPLYAPQSPSPQAETGPSRPAGQSLSQASAAGSPQQLPSPQGPRSPQPKPPKAAKEWFYEYQGEVVGPVSEKDLRVAAENETLTPKARVWSAGLDDWQPAIAILPRVFDGLEFGSGFGWQKTTAAVLATVAFASVLAFGGVYMSKGRKGAADRQDVVKNDAGPAPAPAPAPTPPPDPAPKLPPPPSPKVNPPASPPASSLTASQIMARFGPSVALVTTGDGSGSGFIASPNLVVTNSHVVEGSLSDQFKVSFPSSTEPKKQYEARLIYEDRPRDLAILEVITPLPPVKLATSPLHGEDVVVVGSPAIGPGQVAQNDITKGVLSAINAELAGRPYYRIDAAVNPGNSGGPVFNSRGEVLGVVTLRLNNKQQMNYIVPFEFVAKAVEQAKGAKPAEITEVVTRHDSKVVAIRLWTATLAYAAVTDQYAEAWKDAAGKKPDEAIRTAKQRWLPKGQAKAKYLASPEIIRMANRLGVVGGTPKAAVRSKAIRESLELLNEFAQLANEPFAMPAYFDNRSDSIKHANKWWEGLHDSLGMDRDELKSNFYHQMRAIAIGDSD
jgi:S1-C subfamily serine protease